MPHHTTRPCTVCGTPFTPLPQVPRAKYCSPRCRLEGAKTAYENTCIICGVRYRCSATEAKEGKTCSRKCHGRHIVRLAQERVERRYEMPIATILRYFYESKQMGIQSVADTLGVNNRSVMNWMAEFGIPVRKRSDAVALQWQGNTKRRKAQARRFVKALAATPEQCAANSLRGNLAQQNRKGPTSIERAMMLALDAAGIAYEFQYLIGNKFLCDLAMPAACLVVECDGDYWHNTERQRKRDASKDAYLRACGFTVLRFKGSQIESDVQSCVHAIRALLPPSQ